MTKPWKTTIHVPAEVRGWGESKRTWPALDVTLAIDIDWNAIANDLGAKAARSKGRRCIALGGRIKIKATQVTVKKSTP